MLGLGFGVTKGGFVSSLAKTLYRQYVARVTAAGGVFQNAVCALNGLLSLNSKGLLKDASWVLIPDGIEEDIVFAQKPTDGIGDLGFTRASDATYTDSTGVVRRSPYNLASWSEMFSDASWSKTGITVTPNVALAPNGTMTADRIQFSSSNRALTQTTSLGTGVVCTASFYVLGTAGETLLFAAGGLDQLVTLTGSWQRISTTKTSINSTINVSTFGGATARDIFLWGAQLVEGTSALDYFPTTNRQDVPRIDFRNADGTLSTCGRLLLEPQRTNLVPNGLLYNASTGVAYNTTVSGSPMVGVNCARITKNEAAGTLRYAQQACSASVLTGSTTYILSAFFKYDGVDVATSMQFNNSFQWGGISWTQVINIAAAGVTLGASTACTSTVQNWGSGWYRVNVSISTGTTPSGSPVTYLLALPSTLSTGQGFLHALPQLEAGAYPTTYILTTTAAVTRLADLSEKTGVSSLIGQTQGTLFIDFQYNQPTSDVNGRLLQVVGASETANAILPLIQGIGANVNQFQLAVSSPLGSTTAIAASPATLIPFGRQKLAIAYNAGVYTVYRNGSLFASGTNIAPTSLTSINLGSSSAVARNLSNPVNQAALFPTRLTNDQLEALTSDGYDTYALLAQSLNCVLQ